MNKLLIAVLVVCNCSSVWAYEQFYESSESMARGGVEGGSWDAIHSGFNLPHELFKIQNFDLFLKINGQISAETYDLILNPPEAQEGEMENKFDKYFGKKYFINANGVAGFNYKNFMIVPYFKKFRSSAQLNYKVYPEATGYLNEDTGYMIAWGQRFGRFLVGANFMGFKRQYDIYTVDLISSLNDSYEIKDEEKFISINSSLGWVIKENLEKTETVFLSFKNLNSPNQKSKYSNINGDLIPLINLGYQYQSKRWNLEANLLDLNNYYLGLWKNRLRLGVEYKFSEYGFIRSVSTGVIDGALSVGTSVNLFKAINLSFASYEKNIYNFYEKRTRFYNMGLEISF